MKTIHGFGHSRQIVAVVVIAALWQSVPPPLERFVEASSVDERIAKTALERIGAGWQDSYTAMIVDMARLMRPPRRSAEETAEPLPTLDDERSTSSRERPVNEAPDLAARGSPIRRRLLAFLEKHTGRRSWLRRSPLVGSGNSDQHHPPDPSPLSSPRQG